MLTQADLARIRRKNRLFDRLHFIGVNCLIGLTAASIGVLVFKGYYWVAYVKPKLKALQQEQEAALLQEGKNIAT